MTLRTDGTGDDEATERGFARPAGQALPAEFLAMLAEIVRRDRAEAATPLPLLRH